MNSKIELALRCKNFSSPPIWIMRQAGRYLPSYRKLRQHHTLHALFHEPELAAQVTQLPFESLNFDAAILFSDILVIAEVFGKKVHFPEGKAPYIDPPITCPSQVADLAILSVEETLSYVFKTIDLLQNNLPVPLLGFSGAPFTVATYLLQGEARVKEWLVKYPEAFHQLLSKLSDVIIKYLRLQIARGVVAVQIFDSWANLLTYPQFLEFSAQYMQKIVDALRDTHVPTILFCRGSSYLTQELSALSPSAISFDWQRDLSHIRKEVPAHIAVQGNLDPQLLKAPLPLIEEKVTELLQSMKGEPGFIVNLGHGVLPDTPLENVQYFVSLVNKH